MASNPFWAGGIWQEDRTVKCRDSWLFTAHHCNHERVKPALRPGIFSQMFLICLHRDLAANIWQICDFPVLLATHSQVSDFFI